MRTVWKFVDGKGNMVGSLEPFVPHSADILRVCFRPNNDPEDPAEDELEITCLIQSHK